MIRPYRRGNRVSTCAAPGRRYTETKVCTLQTCLPATQPAQSMPAGTDTCRRWKPPSSPDPEGYTRCSGTSCNCKHIFQARRSHDRFKGRHQALSSYGSTAFDLYSPTTQNSSPYTSGTRTPPARHGVGHAVFSPLGSAFIQNALVSPTPSSRGLHRVHTYSLDLSLTAINVVASGNAEIKTAEMG
jgi:hypothetical protein